MLHQKYIEIKRDDRIIIDLHRSVKDIERAMELFTEQMMEQCQIKNVHIIPQLQDSIQADLIEQNDKNSPELSDLKD